MSDILDIIKATDDFLKESDEALRYMPAPDPACHACVTERRLKVIEDFLSQMFPEWKSEGWDNIAAFQLRAEQEEYRKKIIEYNDKFPRFAKKVPDGYRT